LTVVPTPDASAIHRVKHLLLHKPSVDPPGTMASGPPRQHDARTRLRAAETRANRLALSKAEAAQALGVSIDFLEDHVLPELRVVRVGRRRLIPVGELEGWLERHAARPPA
jgi:excisionase family DNA binding protein